MPKKLKSKGYILIITVILSALILTISLGLSKILATEIEFSADLLFAEKAYFAAESGIETALIELKSEPVQNVVDQTLSFRTDQNGDQDDSAQFNLNIQNLVSEFSILIPPQQTKKFRLKKDTDVTLNITDQAVTDFTLNGSHDTFQWKVQCQKNDKTTSIQGKWNGGSLQNQSGTYDDIDGNSSLNERVSTIFANSDPKTCFFSIQNLSNDELEIDITNTQVAPETTTVSATGLSGNRQKTIEFEYSQKNISSFFDFGFLQSEKAPSPPTTGDPNREALKNSTQ